MSKRSPLRVRPSWFTPAVVIGSLAIALGLTALGDNSALAGRGDLNEHSRLAQDDDPTDLRVLDWTLWNVSKYYVEPVRVDPAAMTLAGLEALEAVIPEVLVEPFGAGSVKVRVGTTEREFQADANALWAVGPQVREVFSFINDHAQLSTDEQRQAEYAIVEGVLSTLVFQCELVLPQQQVHNRDLFVAVEDCRIHLRFRQTSELDEHTNLRFLDRPRTIIQQR